LRYVMDRKKTEMSNGKALVSGVRCQPELAYQQFMLTKALAGKNERRMYYHYVQSFKPDENLSPEHVHKIALELADYFHGFEVVVSTQVDRAHLHFHLIINSVSQETGKKLYLDNKSIFRIRDYSDGLCLNHGLSVLKKSEPNYRIKSMSRGEYRASLRGETVKGRGTFAVGNNVAYTYETVGKIDGIKVLRGIGGKHGLPEEAHSSGSYISLYPNESVKQIRLYNSNLTAKTDIEFSVHQGRKTLHVHDYINGVRQKARNLSRAERKKFNKFFGGA